MYNHFGVYNVRLIAKSDSGCYDTFTNNITVLHKPKASFKVLDSVQCFPGNYFHFKNNSVSVNGNLTYNWKFGDGDSSALKNPVHAYDSFAINYYLKLIITDSLSCKDTASKILMISPSPSARFKVNDSILCFKNNSFLLIDTSTIPVGYVSGRKWYFGDGNSDTGIIVHHHYMTDDTFRVMMIATSDKGCNDTAFGYLYLMKSPVVDFLINDTSQCLIGNLYSFNPLFPAFGDRFRWYFGDGKSDMSKNPIHSYLTSDTFSVKFLVINNSGCMDSLSKMVVVNPEPQADFTINNSIQCLKGNSFILNNLSNLHAATGNWFWDFGDSTSDTSKNPTHHFLNIDTFSIKLIATNQFGCKDSVVKTAGLLPSPDASFFINDSIQCFNNNKFNFIINNKLSNANFGWDLGDGTISTNKDSVKHSYTLPGSFNVKLSLTDPDQCKDSTQKTIIVNPSPDATFTINNSSQCLKGNLFAFTSKNQPVTSIYNWDFGDINTSTATNPNHSYINSGNFNVQLIVTSKDNCLDSASQIITVKPNPVTPVASNNSPICEGKTLSFYAFSTPNSSFQWTADNGFTSNLQNPHINGAGWKDSGNYYVKAFLNGCESDSAITHVVIYPEPIVNIGKDNTICQGDHVILDPGYFTSYLWQDSSTKRIFTVNKPGKYSVIVTNSYGCKDSDEVIFKEKCPPRIFIPDAFSPNGDGLNDQFEIVTNNLMHFEIQIFDSWGENIFHSTDPSISWDGTYKGNDCPIGTYTYMIYTTDNDAIIRNFQGIVNLLR